MKIIEPSFDLYTTTGANLSVIHGEDMLRWIERNARISHRSEEAQTPQSWKRFIQAVIIDRSDWSVAEHASVTAVIRVDRGVTHEIVRHRLFGFTMESTRFVNYKKVGEIDVIRPEGLTPELESPWLESIAKSCWAYTVMMERGASPQLARSVLPNALAATLSITGNLRQWRNFFLLRSTKESHPDMRRTVIPMLGEFQRLIPLLYEDIIPLARQTDNLKKAR